MTAAPTRGDASLAEGLLDAWESGRGRNSAEQAAILTGLAAPDGSPTDLDDLSLGERERRLLRLRRLLFGARIDGITDCPECARPFEVDFPLDPLLHVEPADGSRQHEERFGPFELTFRLPTSGDIRAAGGLRDAEDARRLLLARCVVRASRDGEEIDAGDLPRDICVRLGERMGELDPLSDIEMVGTCPECGVGWDVPLDIGSFLWAELDGWARRTLSDIDTLARIYGWSERDVLALSPARRKLYVELALC